MENNEVQNMGPTEPLDTPFKHARQDWDERIGSSRVQAKNWRLFAFFCLLLTFLSMGGFFYQSLKATVEPWVVEVNEKGIVRSIGRVDHLDKYKPKRAVIARELRLFIERIRNIPKDPVILRKNWLDAYLFVTERAKNTLNEYARESDPFSKYKKLAISVENVVVTPVSESTYQITWREKSFNEQGILYDDSNYNGMFVIKFQQPRTSEQLRVNPLGILIDDLHWSRI